MRKYVSSFTQWTIITSSSITFSFRIIRAHIPRSNLFLYCIVCFNSSPDSLLQNILMQYKCNTSDLTCQYNFVCYLLYVHLLHSFWSPHQGTTIFSSLRRGRGYYRVSLTMLTLWSHAFKLWDYLFPYLIKHKTLLQWFDQDKEFPSEFPYPIFCLSYRQRNDWLTFCLAFSHLKVFHYCLHG